MHGMASPRRSPCSTPTAAAAPPVLHDDSARRRHTSGSPIVEEPRLANMSYTACKAAAARESGTRRATQESHRERHSVSRPGSVTISFKNRCRLAVWHDRFFRGSHLSCGFESHREHFLNLSSKQSPPQFRKLTNHSRIELLFRLHVWAVNVWSRHQAGGLPTQRIPVLAQAVM